MTPSQEKSDSPPTILVTGAAGFIGSAVVREALKRGYRVIGIDKLTYAGNPASLEGLSPSGLFELIEADILDRATVSGVFREHRPCGILHLAAESHVDRSIDGPGDFIRTNIEGTFHLLEVAREYFEATKNESPFRFHHISTDEVFGDLEDTAERFHELSRYDPSSPYSASKAASDHLVRAWSRTYGLPTVMTNTSNNYGPRQFPEKLIPHMILTALSGNPLPVYGDGAQVRDWIYVEDHAAGLLDVFEKGVPGETYNLGGNSERRNLEVVETICLLLEELVPERKREGLNRYSDLITHVRDRPGHDRRYAIDSGKVERDIGWSPTETFEIGIRRTVEWYLENEAWWRPILTGDYRLSRLGEG